MKRPTDLELSMAASHVSYEVEQLVVSTLRLFGRPGPADQWDKNAYLECMLVHARNLIEFFAGRPKGRDSRDIAPDDFVSGWTPSADLAGRLRTYVVTIDQQLSHLTWARVRGDKEAWRVSLTEDLVTAFMDFMEDMEASLRLPDLEFLRVRALLRSLGVTEGR